MCSLLQELSRDSYDRVNPVPNLYTTLQYVNTDANALWQVMLFILYFINLQKPLSHAVMDANHDRVYYCLSCICRYLDHSHYLIIKYYATTYWCMEVFIPIRCWLTIYGYVLYVNYTIKAVNCLSTVSQLFYAYGCYCEVIRSVIPR